MQFKRFSGKAVLEIGSGCGYDAYQFCKVGAHYTGIDLAPQNPIVAKKHLEYYGFNDARFLEMDVEKMDFNAQFDFIYTFGVLHHTPEIKKALYNCYKALKPTGEIQIIVYHKWSIFYILRTVFYKWVCLGGFLKRSLAEERSLVEYSVSDAHPLVNVYSKHELKNLLKQTGFRVIKSDTRKLVIDDLPMIRFIWRAYKYIPQFILEYLGRYFGWYISVRAIKSEDARKL